MHCLEVIIARNAAANGISLEENRRLAKEGQFINRTYPPAVKAAADPQKDKPNTTSNYFEFVVAHWQ